MNKLILAVTMFFVLTANGWCGTFINNGNGTVTDFVTELTWQGEDDSTKRNWANAVTYCQDLNLGGRSDWRLPGIKELRSIADNRITSPAIDSSFFSNTQSNSYWSSTTSAANSLFRWFVYFGNASANVVHNSASCFVRCVRGGQ